jgi:hypothetical protein
MMNPTVSLTNLGIDQNVFNDPADKAPKRDLTLTVTPSTELWLRMGPSWLSGSVKEDVVWYQKYASERSASNRYNLGWRVPLSRLTLTTNVAYAKAKERPGYEIDARVQRRDLEYRGSAEIRTFSKTQIGINASRSTREFAQDSTFRGVDLRQQLSYVSTATGLSLRHQLTPLTTLAMDVSRSQDRFRFSSDRDSDSMSVTGSVAFSPFAAITGGASFGYRDFKPLGPSVPEYKGTTGAADLTYTLLGATRFTLRGVRGVNYSYERDQPYYLETGVDGSIAQQIFGPFDIVGRAGAHALAYRDRAGTSVSVSDAVDHIRLYGGGVGFHMGKELRLGFNVDKVRRDSELADRRYDNFKFGTAVTYGF